MGSFNVQASVENTKTYANYYIRSLINPINGIYTEEQRWDYNFMLEYFLSVLYLIPIDRKRYLPEPINSKFSLYPLGQPYYIKKFLNEHKDEFFNKFYYYKGLNSLWLDLMSIKRSALRCIYLG